MKFSRGFGHARYAAAIHRPGKAAMPGCPSGGAIVPKRRAGPEGPAIVMRR